MNLKKTLEKALFFIDELDTRHHKTALLLKIGLWFAAPIEMLGFTLTKKAYRRLIK
jgi:hypothetical protein